MKYRVIACGVFEPYLNELITTCPNQIDLRVLDAGLHSRPHDLRLLTQAEIDQASRDGGYDAVVLFYGLCGRGTANLLSRDIPVVIPRAHDCITLFMGSSEAYLRQFHKNPGTFYHTLGWIEKKINPKNREAAEFYRNYAREGYEKHPEYKELEEKYGKENAEHILAFFDRWKQHYTRAAYIDLGFPAEAEMVQFTEQMADAFGWSHEVIAGDSELMRRVLAGEWDDDRVFVLPPNSRSVSSGDDKIFSAVAVDSEEDEGALSDREIIIDGDEPAARSCGIGLGIDAGGTYTDAVIFDIGERKLIAKAKALTTYHDLVEGIRNALGQLAPELLAQVEVTSLSTTLATNSLVEGRGHKVGLIAISPWDWTEEQLGHRPVINVPGGVSITGEVLEPLDEAACERAVESLVGTEHCAAIVIAGYATVRNPSLANRAREIAQGMYDIPVICSHEVSRRLNAIHGAQTSIANAKLLPIIRDLISSVHRALADFSVPGKLLVVKGDGTPVDESIARARPVETILSGPAASAGGARILTGLDDALILDIGGTTTDCAIVENGRVAVSEDGARIGEWVMSVDAVEISTVGLGGDSRIDFTRDRAITVGPRRNVPLCYLAQEHPSVADFLDGFEARRYTHSADCSAMDILVSGARITVDLSDREAELMRLLEGGPIPALHAAAALGLPSPKLLPTHRLESFGVVKRSGLTPTDLLHASGVFARWSVDAARRALEIFSVMFGKSAERVLEIAQGAVTRRLFEEIVRREVSHENRGLRDIPEDWAFVMNKAFADDGRGLGVEFTLRRPVVAIGAPAEALVPKVSDHMRVQILVPEHADVANAVGAIGSEIVVREEILIRVGEASNYVLHGSQERMEFSELSRATQKAVEIVRKRSRQRAIEAGALAPEVTVSRSDRLGTIDGGGRIFLERRITAVATGGAFSGRALS